MASLPGLRPSSCLFFWGIFLFASLPASAQPPEEDALANAVIAPPRQGFAAIAGRVRSGREALKEAGIEIGTTYIGETFSNLRGGLRRGTIYEGRLDVQVDANLETLAGWQGLTLHANAYQIHGTGPSRYFVGSLAAVSGIEALPATRLAELWLEQSMLDKALSVRAGKLLADAEFFVSPTATLFVNATFGWPVIASSDLPSGGPATPLATPGIRAHWAMAEKTSVSLGLFDGDPARVSAWNATVDPQRRNADGTDFAVRGDPFVVVEAAHAYVADWPGPERTGTMKLGYFHHFGRFDDLRTDHGGLPLASPGSSGLPRRRRGADGVYAVIDQTLYREDAASDRGMAAFLRVAASPSAGSLVSFYADTGLVYKGLFAGRPDDIAGISFAYSRISDTARAADRDYAIWQDLILPLRRSEFVAELTYQAVIAPGFTLQPDLQYIASPGGNTWNSRLPGHLRIRNSTVIGLRATIQY